jgi:hypothetical protein
MSPASLALTTILLTRFGTAYCQPLILVEEVLPRCGGENRT